MERLALVLPKKSTIRRSKVRENLEKEAMELKSIVKVKREKEKRRDKTETIFDSDGVR